MTTHLPTVLPPLSIQPPPQLQPQPSTISHTTHAITTAKIEKIVKPFIGLLGNGHFNGITTTIISCVSLALYVSSSANGKACIWDLASRREVGCIPGAHRRISDGFGRVSLN
eukprot:13177473-Ditylum_brightwellii.AAC.1